MTLMIKSNQLPYEEDDNIQTNIKANTISIKALPYLNQCIITLHNLTNSVIYLGNLQHILYIL